MTATTATIGHGTRSGMASGTRRRAVRHTPIDLASWVAPLAWMTVLALSVCALGAASMLREGVPSSASATMAVRVAPSDTLWSIAQANRLSGVSTARTVEAIARLNGLRGTTIQSGAVLYVPSADAADAVLAQADGATVVR